MFEDKSAFFEDERPKLENIRQKYRRIALRELLAFLSDHYHLNPGWQDGSNVFDGGWQTPEQDFDPSMSPQFEKERGNPPLDCWWCKYPDPLVGPLRQSHQDWMFQNQVPDFTPLLAVWQPTLDRQWLALAGYGFWNEPAPYNEDRWGHFRKTVWIHIRSWLVETPELDCFLEHAKRTHFDGNGIMLSESRNGWLGDYPWAKSHTWLAESCANRKRDWLKGNRARVVETACQVTEKSLLVPSPQTLALLAASWSGKGLEYVNQSGETVALNPSVIESGPEFVLVDLHRFLKSLRSKRLSLVWTVLGDRQLAGDLHGHDFPGAFEFSGVYWVERGKVVGDITQRNRIEPRKRG